MSLTTTEWIYNGGKFTKTFYFEVAPLYLWAMEKVNMDPWTKFEKSVVRAVEI
jgi:hypothetical protein